LTDWDEQNWQELFDSVKVDWALVTGAPLSGKTTLTNTLRKALGGPSRVTIMDHKEVEAQIKSTLGSAEEPFEGKVPLLKVEEAIAAQIAKDKKAGKRQLYVFDNFPGQANATEFARFCRERLKCPPDFVVSTSVPEQTLLLQRFKKRLEVEADLTEEQVEQFRQLIIDFQEHVEPYISSYAEHHIESGRTKLVVVDTTNANEEVVMNVLRDNMAPKVILINHEKRLPVDAIAANLGIKYNFMYLSVYQLIRNHIEQATAFGKRLVASKKAKALTIANQLQGKDEYQEEDYSAAHFDLALVVELVCHTIALQRRPYQSFILLEGLSNSGRL
jgi:adenylate kinase family enzyme